MALFKTCIIFSKMSRNKRISVLFFFHISSWQLKLFQRHPKYLCVNLKGQKYVIWIKGKKKFPVTILNLAFMVYFQTWIFRSSGWLQTRFCGPTVFFFSGWIYISLSFSDFKRLYRHNRLNFFGLIFVVFHTWDRKRKNIASARSCLGS